MISLEEQRQDQANKAIINNLPRIADALERIAEKLDGIEHSLDDIIAPPLQGIHQHFDHDVRYNR